MQLIRLTLFILFLKAFTVFGQASDPNPCHKSTEGTDFWFGFMENRAYLSGHKTEITLTSIYTCNYKIYIGNSTSAFVSQTLIPNTPVTVFFDWNIVEALGSENIQNRAIHLVSDNTLNVYALNWSPNSADAAVIYPTESLGNEYYAMCYDPHVTIPASNGNYQGKNSEFMIVASDDNTDVWITPSKMTDKGQPANIPFSIKLGKGELFQVQSENSLNKAPAQGDLTGSYIKSSKPIAVFSGSYSTTVPVTSNDAFDHLYEQMPPVQTWGRKFITVPLKDRAVDYYRVLASEDNTTVRVGNTTLPVLGKGEKYEFILSTPILIDSDKPILVAQFSASNSVDKPVPWPPIGTPPPPAPQPVWNGDPFMVILSPVNQTREKVGFVAYESKQIKKYYINVVVKDDAVGKINLDAKPINFQSLTGTGYSIKQIEITAGNHYIETTEPGKGFIAYVYGFGGYESYGYGVGFNLDIVLNLGSDINANGEKLVVRCDGEPPQTLNAGNAFDKYKWNTGDTTSTIQIYNSGWYKVKVSTNSGCVLEDSVELQISKPIVNLGRDTTICNPETIILDASDQFTSYLWSTTQTDQKLPVSKSGNYFVEVTNKFDCKARDTVAVSFTDKPKMDFSRLDTLICGLKSTALDLSADKGIITVQRLSDSFMFNGLEVAVPDFGTYLLKIKATDEFSCTSDSLIGFGFRKTPSVDFSVDSAKCYGYNLDVKYIGDARVDASDFTWIYGGDTIIEGIGVESYLVPLGINRSTRDLKLTVTDMGCANEKTLGDIKVIPNLQMWVADSLGCEPFTTQFWANNTETVTYDWDFGDGTVLSGATTDPSHTYQHEGYYPVKLKVTTSKGCTNEVRIDSLIYVAPIPTAGFTPLPAECLENTNHEISYLGSGDPLDTYTWDLSKFDNEEIIQDPDTTQGPLIFNLKNKPEAIIGLSVISKYGCRGDTAIVLVKRKPVFSISSSSTAGCTPFEPEYTGTTGDSFDQVDYNWDFGDGSTGTGDRVKHEYLEPDHKYDVILYALSATTGCADTIYSPALAWTYPKPEAEFSMDNAIVYNDKPTVNFSNLSKGANNYSWDFGDESKSDEKDPSHYYTVTGYRTVLLEAFNEFLCSDTITHQLLVAFDRIFPPNAFSPNAPNIIDREYKLSSNGVAAEGYHLTILSRWNDIVFETREEIKGWNGQMPNGSFAPAGAYVWILNFTDYLGRKHRQTGTVTLVY